MRGLRAVYISPPPKTSSCPSKLLQGGQFITITRTSLQIISWTREPSCSGANSLGTATWTTVASMSYPNTATCEDIHACGVPSELEYRYYKMTLLKNL